MGGWLVGEGHSWLSSPWPTKDASFAFFSILLCIDSLIDSFVSTRAVPLTCNRPEPPLGRALPISDIYEGNTDNHSPACQHLTRWSSAKQSAEREDMRSHKKPRQGEDHVSPQLILVNRRDTITFPGQPKETNNCRLCDRNFNIWTLMHSSGMWV